MFFVKKIQMARRFDKDNITTINSKTRRGAESTSSRIIYARSISQAATLNADVPDTLSNNMSRGCGQKAGLS